MLGKLEDGRALTGIAVETPGHKVAAMLAEGVWYGGQVFAHGNPVHERKVVAHDLVVPRMRAPTHDEG